MFNGFLDDNELYIFKSCSVDANPHNILEKYAINLASNFSNYIYKNPFIEDNILLPKSSLSYFWKLYKTANEEENERENEKKRQRVSDLLQKINEIKNESSTKEKPLEIPKSKLFELNVSLKALEKERSFNYERQLKLTEQNKLIQRYIGEIVKIQEASLEQEYNDKNMLKTVFSDDVWAKEFFKKELQEMNFEQALERIIKEKEKNAEEKIENINKYIDIVSRLIAQQKLSKSNLENRKKVILLSISKEMEENPIFFSIFKEKSPQTVEDAFQPLYKAMQNNKAEISILAERIIQNKAELLKTKEKLSKPSTSILLTSNVEIIDKNIDKIFAILDDQLIHGIIEVSTTYLDQDVIDSLIIRAKFETKNDIYAGELPGIRWGHADGLKEDLDVINLVKRFARNAMADNLLFGSKEKKKTDRKMIENLLEERNELLQKELLPNENKILNKNKQITDACIINFQEYDLYHLFNVKSIGRLNEEQKVNFSQIKTKIEETVFRYLNKNQPISYLDLKKKRNSALFNAFNNTILNINKEKLEKRTDDSKVKLMDTFVIYNDASITDAKNLYGLISKYISLKCKFLYVQHKFDYLSTHLVAQKSDIIEKMTEFVLAQLLDENLINRFETNAKLSNDPKQQTLNFNTFIDYLDDEIGIKIKGFIMEQQTGDKASERSLYDFNEVYKSCFEILKNSTSLPSAMKKQLIDAFNSYWVSNSEDVWFPLLKKQYKRAYRNDDETIIRMLDLPHDKLKFKFTDETSLRKDKTPVRDIKQYFLNAILNSSATYVKNFPLARGFERGETDNDEDEVENVEAGFFLESTDTPDSFRSDKPLRPKNALYAKELVKNINTAFEFFSLKNNFLSTQNGEGAVADYWTNLQKKISKDLYRFSISNNVFKGANSNNSKGIQFATRTMACQLLFKYPEIIQYQLRDSLTFLATLFNNQKTRIEVQYDRAVKVGFPIFLDMIMCKRNCDFLNYNQNYDKNTKRDIAKYYNDKFKTSLSDGEFNNIADMASEFLQHRRDAMREDPYFVDKIRQWKMKIQEIREEIENGDMRNLQYKNKLEQSLSSEYFYLSQIDVKEALNILELAPRQLEQYIVTGPTKFKSKIGINEDIKRYKRAIRSIKEKKINVKTHEIIKGMLSNRKIALKQQIVDIDTKFLAMELPTITKFNEKTIKQIDTLNDEIKELRKQFLIDRDNKKILLIQQHINKIRRDATIKKICEPFDEKVRTQLTKLYQQITDAEMNCIIQLHAINANNTINANKPNKRISERETKLQKRKIEYVYYQIQEAKKYEINAIRYKKDIEIHKRPILKQIEYVDSALNETIESPNFLIRYAEQLIDVTETEIKRLEDYKREIDMKMVVKQYAWQYPTIQFFSPLKTEGENITKIIEKENPMEDFRMQASLYNFFYKQYTKRMEELNKKIKDPQPQLSILTLKQVYDNSSNFFEKEDKATGEALKTETPRNIRTIEILDSCIKEIKEVGEPLNIENSEVYDAIWNIMQNLIREITPNKIEDKALIDEIITRFKGKYLVTSEVTS